MIPGSCLRARRTRGGRPVAAGPRHFYLSCSRAVSWSARLLARRVPGAAQDSGAAAALSSRGRVRGVNAPRGRYPAVLPAAAPPAASLGVDFTPGCLLGARAHTRAGLSVAFSEAADCTAARVMRGCTRYNTPHGPQSRRRLVRVLPQRVLCAPAGGPSEPCHPSILSVRPRVH